MALTTPRNTPRRMTADFVNSTSVLTAASQTFYPGALVALNASGYLVPASTATTLTAVGVIGEQPFLVPATSYVSGAVAGVLRLEVQKGVFKFTNQSNDLITQAEIGKVCYMTDDETVCKTGTGKSIAGTVWEIDPDDGGVWVNIGATPAGLVGGVGPTGPTGPTGP